MKCIKELKNTDAFEQQNSLHLSAIMLGNGGNIGFLIAAQKDNRNDSKGNCRWQVRHQIPVFPVTNFYKKLDRSTIGLVHFSPAEFFHVALTTIN